MTIPRPQLLAYIRRHSPANAIRHFQSLSFRKLCAMTTAFAFAALCVSCSTQVVTKPDGTRYVNNNLLSRGILTVNADGSVSASGNAEKAASELGNYGKALLNAGLIRTGIQAVNPAVKTITDAVTD